MTQDKNYIEKVLTLSTDHVDALDPQFGLTEKNSPRVVEHEYGWIVFVDEGVICADWFKPIMQDAIKEGCTLILFDSDALTDVKYKTYTWKV